jgi:cobalt-zinc-cadmium resistance protein CzcA
MNKKINFSSILMLFSIYCFAQNPKTLSLAEAVTLAKQNSSTLKIENLEVERQTTLKGAALELDPLQVQYQGGQFNTKAFDHNISAQQYFPLKKTTKANTALQTELAKLAEKHKILTAYELEKAVTLSFYQYLYAQNLLKLNAELDSLYGRFLKNTELKFKTGEGNQIEVLAAKAKKQEIEFEYQQLTADVKVYLLQFQFFIEDNEAVFPNIETPLQYVRPYLQSPSVAVLSEYYEQKNAILKQENEVLKQKLQPKIGGGYFMQSIDKAFLYQGFTLGVQIPLYKKATQVRQNANDLAMQQNNFAYRIAIIQTNIKKTEHEIATQKAQDALNYFQQIALPNAEKIIAMSFKSYSAGEIDYFQYARFLEQAIDVKKKYAEALQEYNRAAIEAYFGMMNIN